MQMMFALKGDSANFNFEFRSFLSGIVVICYASSSLYAFQNWTLWNEVSEILKSSVLILLLSVLYVYANNFNFSRFAIIAGILIFVPADIIARYLVRRIFYKAGLFSSRVLIIGAGNAGELFAQKITSHKFMCSKILGFLDDDESKQNILISGLPVLGKLNDFENIQLQIKADEAVIAIPTASRQSIAKILSRIENNINYVKYIPDMYMLTTLSAIISNMDGMPVISARQGLLNPVNRIIKSFMDYFGRFLALILFSPLMIFAAIKIKLEDGGDIFFKHKRVGQDLKNFYVYKFRSMVSNAQEILKEMLKDENLKKEFSEAFKFKDDPRVTKTGKFLRKTSIDEMPQIFNVLRGEMSLVGPRPIVDEEVKKYYGYNTSKQIFHIKPGLTGFWQVSGRNDVKDYRSRIEFDLYYIHNWSVWLDVIIILRTVREVISGKGAY